MSDNGSNKVGPDPRQKHGMSKTNTKIFRQTALVDLKICRKHSCKYANVCAETAHIHYSWHVTWINTFAASVLLRHEGLSCIHKWQGSLLFLMHRNASRCFM